MITAEQAREQLGKKKELSMESAVDNLSIESEIVKAIDELESSVDIIVPIGISKQVSAALQHYGYKVSLDYGEESAKVTIKW